MNNQFPQRLAIVGFALITCFLAALANLLVERTIGINVFTFSMWLVIPVGALIVGFAGSSGILVGARYFNVRPSWFEASCMVIIAGITMALIYYLSYATLVFDDGRKVSGLVSFSEYLEISITKAHYRVGRGGTDTGEVGSIGYWIAAIQFVGFLVGGAATYFWIGAMPMCKTCSVYYKKVRSKATPEMSVDDGNVIYEKVATPSVESLHAAISHPIPKIDKNEKKRVRLTFTLLACPKCKNETLKSEVQMSSGGDWKDVTELTRLVGLPEGETLKNAFR